MEDNNAPYDKKTFLLIGENGSGKSTFLNYVYNYKNGEKNVEEIFTTPTLLRLAIPAKHWKDNVAPDTKHSEKDVDNQTISQTSLCTGYSISIENEPYCFIDTPGFNSESTDDGDKQTTDKIINVCVENDFISGLVLVVNGTSPRLNTPIKSFIAHLKNLLPTDILQNAIIVFTNCDEDGCNFEINTLNQLFKSPKVFYMQNNLLKWDKSELRPKMKRLFNTKWTDSLETIERMLEAMKDMKPVSTASMKSIRDKTKELFKLLNNEMSKISELLDDLNAIEVQKKVIVQTENVMGENQNKELQFTIEAIPIIMPESKKAKRKKIIKSRLTKIKTKFEKMQENFEKMNVKDDDMDDDDENTGLEDFLEINRDMVEMYKLFEPELATNFESIVDELERKHKDKIKKNAKEMSKKADDKSTRKKSPPRIVKLDVKLEDSETISRYKNAEKQKDLANLNLNDLNDNLKRKHAEINECFEKIQVNMAEIQSLINGFDFTNYFYPVLNEMKNKLDIYKSDILNEFYNKLKVLLGGQSEQKKDDSVSMEIDKDH